MEYSQDVKISSKIFTSPKFKGYKVNNKIDTDGLSKLKNPKE